MKKLQAELAAGKLLLGWQNGARQKQIGFAAARGGSTKSRAVFAPEETHLLTVAPTGAGKGRNAIIPTLLTYPGAAVVIDPKGEALAVTGEYRAKLGPVVAFDPFGEVMGDHSDGINPVEVWRSIEDAPDLAAQEIKDIIFGGVPRSNKEPFWDDSAEHLGVGGLIHVVSTENEEKRHLGYLYEMFHGRDTIYSLAQLLDVEKHMHPMAQEIITDFLATAEVTRSGILSTFLRGVSFLGYAAVREHLSQTTFDLDRLATGEPVTIYLVLPATKLHSFSQLLRLWLSSLLNFIQHRRQRRPELPTLFLVDEAGQLGRFEMLRTAYTLMRYKGVRVWSFWQDLSQLRHLYPQDWQAILNNAGAVQAFGVPNYLMADELAKLLHAEQLSAHRLLSLPRDRQIILLPGGRIIEASKPDYLKDAIFQGRYGANPSYGEGGLSVS